MIDLSFEEAIFWRSERNREHYSGRNHTCGGNKENQVRNQLLIINAW